MTQTRWLALVLVLSASAGCGTTRITDTQRTATEQLLVSNAVDQAVSELDFRHLAGKTVYFDPQYLDGVTDRGYVISSIRQHLLACGCILKEDRGQAEYVVEARSGGIGTDRHSLLIGVPQMNLPTILPGQPSSIPEIPVAKKTDQKGVAKIAVYAYNRRTGRPAWQSGVVQQESTAKDTWILGVGPIQRGTIRKGTEFAGAPIRIPLVNNDEDRLFWHENPANLIPVTQAAKWSEPEGIRQVSATKSAKQPPSKPKAKPAPKRKSEFAVDSLPPEKPVPPPPPPAPSKPVKLSPVPPNRGGHAETEPAKVIKSGVGKPRL